MAIRDTARVRVAVLVVGLLLLMQCLCLAVVPIWIWSQTWRTSPVVPDPGTGSSVRFHFSVFDRAQEAKDRLPDWSASEMEGAAKASSRLVAVSGDISVYLFGADRGFCIIVVDRQARTTGSGCQVTQRGIAEGQGWLAFTPGDRTWCPIQAVAVPDDYAVERSRHITVLAEGENGAIVAVRRSAPVSLVSSAPSITIDSHPMLAC